MKHKSKSNQKTSPPAVVVTKKRSAAQKNENKRMRNKQKMITNRLDESFSALQQTRPKPSSLPKGIQMMNDLDTQLARLNKTFFF